MFHLIFEQGRGTGQFSFIDFFSLVFVLFFHFQLVFFSFLSLLCMIFFFLYFSCARNVFIIDQFPVQKLNGPFLSTCKLLVTWCTCIPINPRLCGQGYYFSLAFLCWIAYCSQNSQGLHMLQHCNNNNNN